MRGLYEPAARSRSIPSAELRRLLSCLSFSSLLQHERVRLMAWPTLQCWQDNSLRYRRILTIVPPRQFLLRRGAGQQSVCVRLFRTLFHSRRHRAHTFYLLQYQFLRSVNRPTAQYRFTVLLRMPWRAHSSPRRWRSIDVIRPAIALL